jgi:zona occludens toxin (predicted ATPase)
MNPKRILLIGAAISSLIFFTGCQSSSPKTTAAAAPAPAVTPAAVTPAAVATPAPVAAATTPTVAPASVPVAIRINAGGPAVTNTDGTVWLADQGFADGETVERPDIQVANAGADEAIYHSEHYSMSAFSQPVPNGKYTVKLRFAETYEGVTDKGQRVFTVNVQGQDFKDLDVFDKAGGALRAYVITVPVEVTNGKLDITFTANIENPEINGIEIIPAQ